ncbi:ABC transporter permease [Arthrobacter wenxiniae]|uniref:Iron ABC transporter permease n=1 Tax=Arthrobacter wenxiniae TaxID=2713570 RepID=A0A7Y7IHB8_9MICC|nr:iron ABC transporter permease [Arthrobacter wenxiniae]NVM95494.1 iron ABC transporter permease [Arthrobacter wenxiniae]
MTTTRTERAVKPPAGRSALPAPKYPRVFGAGRGRIVQYGVFILLAIFVVAPIVPIFYQSFRDRPLYEAGGILTASNYVKLFTDAGFGQVVLNTAIFAIGTTVLTLVIAIPMAVLVVRTKLPFGRALGLSMQWPFFISTLILGFGWITLYGPAGFISVQLRQVLGFVPWNLYSLGGMAVTEAVGLAPIAYVFCANALRQADASLESAARVCGAGPVRILFKVVVPMLRPPIVYSSILVFSMSLETLSVPLLYGTPVRIEVFSTFLYTNGLQSIQPDYGILGAASTIILAVTIATVAIQAKVLKNAQRFISVRGKATRPRPLDLGWIRWVAVVAIVIYIIFGALLPILGLVFRSFTMIFTPLQNPFRTLTLSNYERVFTFPVYVQSITNSVVVAVAGAVLVSVLALLAVLVARRSPFKFARSVEYLALAPQAMPGIIVGIGFFWAFALTPGGGWIQGTLMAVIIAFGLRALPTAFGSIAPAIMQIGRELDDAARTSGADWFATFFRILRTLLRPAFVGAIILVFVTMMKEYSAALFLSSANTGVIGTTMLDLWVQGNTGSVAALATIQIAITAVFVAVANMFMKGHTDA